MDWLGFIFALVIMLAGLGGMFMPFVPGAPLIILGMVVYGLFYDFHFLTWYFGIGQCLLTALTYLTDYIATALGVRHYGGTRHAIIGCIAGGIAGLILFGPLGILFGPFLGAMAGELISKRPPAQAARIALGILLGFAGGAIAKVIIGIVMIAWFLLAI